jgi:hypothetical protein
MKIIIGIAILVIWGSMFLRNWQENLVKLIVGIVIAAIVAGVFFCIFRGIFWDVASIILAIFALAVVILPLASGVKNLIRRVKYGF